MRFAGDDSTIRVIEDGTRLDRVSFPEILFFAFAFLIPIGGGGLLLYFVSRTSK